MALGLEALAAVAFLHQVFSRCQSSRLVEPMAEGFGYDCFGGCVMATLTKMNISEQLQPLVRLDTALENASGVAMEELIVDDGVCARSALDLPSFYLVLGEDAIHQKITKWLCPRWDIHYHQNGCSYWLECCGSGCGCF